MATQDASVGTVVVLVMALTVCVTALVMGIAFYSFRVDIATVKAGHPILIDTEVYVCRPVPLPTVGEAAP